MTYKQVHFKIKEAYGVRRAYPVCDNATYLCRLTGTKTLQRQALPNIFGLGFEPVDQDGLTIDVVSID